MNHLFLDGNKRIAAAILNIGLKANDIVLKVSDEEMIEEFFNLAASRITYDDFLLLVRTKIEK